jgi:hypothetical protein
LDLLNVLVVLQVKQIVEGLLKGLAKVLAETSVKSDHTKEVMVVNSSLVGEALKSCKIGSERLVIFLTNIRKSDDGILSLTGVVAQAFKVPKNSLGSRVSLPEVKDRCLLRWLQAIVDIVECLLAGKTVRSKLGTDSR